jgi:hypothetical protein
MWRCARPGSRRRRGSTGSGRSNDYLDKIEELVARSKGRVRADVVHLRLVAMGFTGGERTTRRTVAEVKARLRAGQRRVFRPWVTEPGLWMQWARNEGELGRGPPGRRPAHEPVVRVAGLVPVPGARGLGPHPAHDRGVPGHHPELDLALRRLGGVPTYALTDNERTNSIDHVAGVAVRHPEIVAVGRHYGMTIRTCVPADPQSKGGSEATVRVAKADIRAHREARRPPVEMLAEEQARLHPLPTAPFTVAFGTTRRVN